MDFFSEIADAGSTEDVAEELARVARCSELFSKDGAASLQGRKRLIKAGMVFYDKGGIFRSSKALLTLLFNDCIMVCVKERAQLQVKHSVQFGEAFHTGPLDASKPLFTVNDPGFGYIRDRAAVLRGEMKAAAVPEAFQFDVVGPDGALSFRASNAEEKHEWIQAIAKSILASTPLDLRLQGDVAGLYTHRLRDDTLHAAVVGNASDFIEIYGLCTAEGVERACTELRHACYDAETLLAGPIKGASAAAGSEAASSGADGGTGMGVQEGAASRMLPEVVRGTSDPVTASLISALEMSARELLAVAKPAITGSGPAALAAAQAYAVGESVSEAIRRAATPTANTSGSGSGSGGAGGSAGSGGVSGGSFPAEDAPAEGEAGSEAFSWLVGRSVLGHVADIDCEDLCGRSPLLLAALLSRNEAARALMRAGCSVAAVGPNMQTSLHIAAQNGNASLAAILAEHGAPLNGPQAKDILGRSPLQAAVLGRDAGAAPAIVRALVSAGATADGTDLFGVSLIHVAVLRGPGFEGCIPALAAAGADVNAPLLETAASAAAIEATREAAELRALLHKGSAPSPSPAHAESEAHKSGDDAVVMVGCELGKGRGSGGLTALHLACGAGQEGDGATATLLHSFAAKLDPDTSGLLSSSEGGSKESFEGAAGSAAASSAAGDDADVTALPAEVAALAAAASSSMAVPAATSLTIGLGRVSPAAIRELLAAGAKPNVRSGPSTGCLAPLHMLAYRVARAAAGRAEPAESFAGPGSPPTSPGGTAVDLAAVSAASAALAAGGARHDVVDGSGKTPDELFAACRTAGVAVDVKRLLDGRRARPPLEEPPRAGLGLAAVPESALLRPASPAELASLRAGGGSLVAASLLARRLLRAPSAVAVSPAAFLPDEAAVVCMGCGAEFGWFVRRHHCRACNAVVCSECSAATTPLFPPGTDVFRAGMVGGPAVPFSQERACDGCVNKLVADAVLAGMELSRKDKTAREAAAQRQARDEAFQARRAAQRAERDRLLASSAARQVLDEDDLAKMRSEGRGGMAGTMAAMHDTREALARRGEQLDRTTEQSQQLASAGQDFAKLAKQLEKQSKGRFMGLF